MARIARAFEGAPDAMDAHAAAAYVQNRLGRVGGSTFLTELRPFPAERTARSADLRNFGDEAQIQRWLQDRKEEELRLLRSGPVRCVICYGAGLHKQFANYFGWEWRLLRSFTGRSKQGNIVETPIYQADTEFGSGRSRAKAFRLPFLGGGAISTSLLEKIVTTPEFVACRE